MAPMALLDKEIDPLADEQALLSHIERALAVKVPSGLEVELTYRLIKRACNPMILGSENIPKEPCLFVGNHSLFALDGAIITPLFLKELHRFPRAMGDKFLFSIEPIANFLVANGLVMGHPKVCSALMEQGEDILVFPGGAYEAVKPASKRYELQWKERYGFVKLAAMHGYNIMPFGLVGPDEFYSHLVEGEDIPDSALGWLLTHLGLLNESTRVDILPPLPRGTLGTPFPKPQRCYLGFGQPLNLSHYTGKKLHKKTLHDLRSQVAEQIESQLTELLLTREQFKGEDSLLRRLLTL